MKSPYQIAKEIGVSPQAVYKRLTDEFVAELDNHIQRSENGKYSLDAEAERLLKELYNHVEQPNEQSVDEPVEYSLLNQLNSENTYLRQQIEALEVDLRTEREHNRTQADRISGLAEQLAELTRNNQILLGAEQSRTNPALLAGGKLPVQEENKAPKKGVFYSLKRVFSKDS